MARKKPEAHDSTMIRRFVALALWTYFAWYLGALLAAFTAGPDVAGPIAALLTIALGSVGWARSRRAPHRELAQQELQPTR